jgi:hypothetical protein
MMTRALAISVGLLSVATSVVFASSLTERLQTERMTVVRVDRLKSQFLCAEHRLWVPAAKADLAALAAGDIVRIEQRDGRLAKVTVVRTAAEELTSPER